MRTGISIEVTAADRRRLEALVRDRNSPQKHAWRAEIVLLSADGLGTVEIMRRTAKSKTCIWRWQERFAEEGVEGPLRDKTRRSRMPPLAAEVAERVVALTLDAPPGEATHGTATMTAEAAARILSSSGCSCWGIAARKRPSSILRPKSPLGARRCLPEKVAACLAQPHVKVFPEPRPFCGVWRIFGGHFVS